ncbi:hypothetical protein [Mycolicibacterium peregrinum]|uniref:hypothetical protein n=1 Tax=Mycolicibacterium peregrinum TaxID=43304 RepID=UPI0007EC10FF|nr:hypothetical protein [Mycolicibacterium peregrinum]
MAIQSRIQLAVAAVATAGLLVGCATSSTPAPVTSTVTQTIKASAEEQAALDQRSAQVDQREASVAARESQVSQAEQLAKMNTIPSGDGLYLVGTEIQPGTYRTSGASGCYYAALRGLSGSNSDIRTNQNTDGPSVVEILPSDVGFQVSRCAEWHRLN